MPYVPSAAANAAYAQLGVYFGLLGRAMSSVPNAVKALFDAVFSQVGGAHTDGAAVAWAAGTGPGQVSFGPAAPNGVLVSAVGCDEGVVVTFTAGVGTMPGAFITVHFATPFQNPPSFEVFPANDAAAHLMFVAELHGGASTDHFSLSTAAGISPLSNTTYAFSIANKGSR